MITGFDTYSETKLYMPCPHCEHQIETNLPQFILAMNGRKKIICAACTREYELKVELQDSFGLTPHGAVTEHSQAYWTCKVCHAENHLRNKICWLCKNACS